MKTLKLKSLLVLLFAAVIGITAASAKNPEQKKDIRQVLKETVNYPEFALNSGDRATVDVAFRVADNGKLAVRKISSTNPKFTEFVKEKIENADLTDVRVDKFKTYKIRISFELQ